MARAPVVVVMLVAGTAGGADGDALLLPTISCAVGGGTSGVGGATSATLRWIDEWPLFPFTTNLRTARPPPAAPPREGGRGRPRCALAARRPRRPWRRHSGM